MLGLVIVSIILANLYCTLALCKSASRADDQLSNSEEVENVE